MRHVLVSDWLICLGYFNTDYKGRLVCRVYDSSLVLRLFVSFWDICSIYVSKSSVQFILDHFVPILILIRAFPPQLLII